MPVLLAALESGQYRAVVGGQGFLDHVGFDDLVDVGGAEQKTRQSSATRNSRSKIASCKLAVRAPGGGFETGGVRRQECQFGTASALAHTTACGSGRIFRMATLVRVQGAFPGGRESAPGRTSLTARASESSAVIRDACNISASAT